jgi:pyruvate dehydrogenase E2 component (dihydrolipoamide acetyltransferase)
MAEFLMPSLGADMEAGTILKWYVQPGDTVHRGDLVALVDTSKAEIDIEVFEDATVDELLVPVGERVAVGTPIALLSSVAERAAVAEARGVAEPIAAAEPVPVTESAAVAEPVGAAAHRPRISPLARRVAEDLHVDLGALTGTGRGGAIVRADVERAATANGGAQAPSAAPTPEPAAAALAAPARDRIATMRATLASLMARSKREIPHYYLRMEIDVSEPLERLRADNLERAVEDRVLPAALLLRASARAARDVPELNGLWIDGGHRRSEAVHLGVAISMRGGGLIAPAIHDAEDKSVEELMRALRDLVARARSGGLRGSEMADPTITVTNLGDQGVDEVLPVIYPPQVAIVGFGRIRERPWAADGMVGARAVVVATVAGDHRASTGAEGARFLTSLARHLRNPETP